MKQLLSILFAGVMIAGSAPAAIVAYINPTNNNVDTYWPDLPNAKNFGGSTNFDFSNSRQGFYITSSLDGTNARGVIFYGTAPGQPTSPWTLQIAATATGQVDRLSFGSLIGPSTTWISNTAPGSLETAFETNLSTLVAETMYVGFRRLNNVTGEVYYGWSELKTVPLRTDNHEESWATLGLSSAGLKFTENAYDNAGLSIFAGQYVTIPEPGSLTLTGAGALLGFVRRRRH